MAKWSKADPSESGSDEVTALRKLLPDVLSDLVDDYVPTFVAVTFAGEEIFCREVGEIDVNQVQAIHVSPGKTLYLPDRWRIGRIRVVTGRVVAPRDCSGMFSNTAWNGSLVNWDTSRVTDMRGMFQGCTSLVTVPKFDTSQVTSVYGMFQGCTSLVRVPKFDTSRVTSMDGMFQGCTSLVTVPNFDTSSVTTIFWYVSRLYFTGHRPVTKSKTWQVR